MNRFSVLLKFRFHFVLIATTFLLISLLGPTLVQAQPANIRYAKQGLSMRSCLNNQGVVGRAAYPNGVFNIPPDSIGLEYPLGQPYEHVFGTGLWVGGKLDTVHIGTGTPLNLVSTVYEGWSGPYFEFFPGSAPADSIWKVNGRGVPRPPTWETYWGNSISRISISDNDHYCTYTDTLVRVTAHVPLRLKIVQSSYVWSDPYAEAIHIMEYKITNAGVKQIDSSYVGVFLDGDVGPFNVANYSQRNYAGYYQDIRTAYINNPADPGSTPVGITALHASRPLDSLRYSFRTVAELPQPVQPSDHNSLCTPEIRSREAFPLQHVR